MKSSIIVFCVLLVLALITVDAKGDDSLSAPGHLTGATNMSGSGIIMANQDAIRTFPITVELWARILNADNYNVLVASDPKPSSQHWELFTKQTSGFLCVYLGGQRGGIDSETNICDNAWHYIAVTFDKDQASLYVDGKLIKQGGIVAPQGDPQPGDIAVGQLLPGFPDVIGCNGYIQDVRISSGIREIKSVPPTPFKKDATTIVLWPLNSK